MKILLFLASILLMQPVFSMSLVERTAILALKEAKHSPTGMTREHGGMIFQRDSEFGPLIEYLEPIQGGKFDGVRVIDKDQLQPNDKMVATYHIHICMKDYYHAVFSYQDIVVAILSGTPEFMLDTCTGDIHEFDPKVDKIHDTGIEAHLFGPDCEKVDRHLPAGRIIGNIGETEEERIAPEEVPCRAKSKAK